MNSNEKFIHQNTRTSHKRLESMVLYALHYALRDVEIRSQYPVIDGSNHYYIDAYLPAMKLAVEVDEPHHANQIHYDQQRQDFIQKTLNCDFIRINCDSSIYEQVDAIVSRVKSANVASWNYQPRILNIHTGAYSQRHIQNLEANNIPELMGEFAEELKRDGYTIEEGNVRGIPSSSNGELGFLVKRANITFAVYARATGKVNVRVMELGNDVSDFFAKILHPRQIKNSIPRYYALPDNQNGYENKDEAKSFLDEFVRKFC